MKHTDLMKRLNDAGYTPINLTEDHDEFGNEWRNADKRAGFVRYEAQVSISKLRNFVSKLFGREKS